MMSSATFSPCGTYRYTLTRQWDPLRPAVALIGLNPSTADHVINDPTIRRCISFAKAWGYGQLRMVNLFALRATNPAVMLAAADPVGSGNDDVLRFMAATCTLVVAAWGTKGIHMGRDAYVRQLIPRLHYLRLTKGGHPEHPLYLPKTLTPIEWSFR